LPGAVVAGQPGPEQSRPTLNPEVPVQPTAYLSTGECYLAPLDWEWKTDEVEAIAMFNSSAEITQSLQISTGERSLIPKWV
jgi:hypothetical protein